MNQLLTQDQAESCSCSKQGGPDRAGCLPYPRKFRPNAHWCWVDKEKRAICQLQGITLHQTKDGGYWTDELCQHAGCSCSHQGMAPLKKTSSENAIAVHRHGEWCDMW